MGTWRVIGWKLPGEDRARLLDRFPPSYPDVVADHVTLQADAPAHAALPPAENGRVVGIADDGHSLQALVVEIGGTTGRPDGSTYHITWSLDRAAGRKPVESNDLIREKGWREVAPVPIALAPARID
jgi:hypothetical protein